MTQTEEPNFTHEFFATSGVQDFQLKNVGPAPEGYPKTPVPDEYSRTVCAETYEERKDMFIAHVLRNPGPNSLKSIFYELIRLSEGKGPIHQPMLDAALEYVNGRYDCADFVLSGIIRLYYQFLDSPMLTDEFRERAKEAILGFKYWPDEPGIDSMCYWTENHHIIFSANEYLAGQLFPDEVFTNSGHTGRTKIARAQPRIEKWLELRFYTGFSEWLSNVYYDEDFAPLLNLLDFADDKNIRRRSKLVTDLMLYDMAINSYYGLFACTHGRTYTKEKTHPKLESTADTAKLMFGLGTFANEDNMSAVLFALSKYEMPQVIFDIATDTARAEHINKQRVSIKFSEAKKWGYGKMDLESAMGLLSFGGYSHPRTINHMILMLDEFRWWDNQFFLEFRPSKKILRSGRHFGLTNFIMWLYRKDYSRNVMDECNIYTYRTSDYMLSTAQAYRPSYGGDQHHIWQATLDGEAVCFTTHPGGHGMQAPNGYWHGNGFMPKAVQHENVAAIIYNTPQTKSEVMDEVLPFTHAFFPKARFDEVVERDGWVFGRKGDGYIALYSQNGYRWQTEGEYADQELIADGMQNIWLTEMGRKETHGSFAEFGQKICTAALEISGQNIRYDSPSLGRFQTGWKRGLRVAGESISIKDYKRYENPSSVTEFDADTIKIQYGAKTYTLTF